MNISKTIRDALINYLPRTPGFDRRVHTLQFMQRSSGATPTASLSFRDKTFRKLIGDALDDILVKSTTDKLHAKRYIDGVLLRRAAIPTEAVFRTIEDAEDYAFKTGSMIRTTHSYVVPQIVTGPESLSYSQMDDWLKQDYYRDMRERNYKGLQPGIIVEPYLKDGETPIHVVAFCYNGKTSLLHSLEFQDGGKTRKRRFYDLDWNPLEFSIWDALLDPISKPKKLKNFIEDCSSLSEPFEIVAVEGLIYKDGSYVFTGFSHCPDGNGAKIIPPSATAEFNARFFRLPPYGDS